MKKVGFLGGSFDPIHFGHLKLAKELADRNGLEEVWFCPAKVNPHKQEIPPVDIFHRLKMVALAIEEDPQFSLLTLEAERDGASYTVDTLQTLVKREQESANPRQIVLILTDELIHDFIRWKDPKRIVETVPLLIGSRQNSSSNILNIIEDVEIREAMRKGWCPTDLLTISSTELRKKLAKGEDCEEWIPQKVLDYIAHHKLYSLSESRS